MEDVMDIIEILNRCGYIKIDTSKVFTSILPTYEAIVNLDNFNINNLSNQNPTDNINSDSNINSNSNELLNVNNTQI